MENLVSPVLSGRIQLVDIQWLADDILDRHTWIQRRIRILENHLHIFPQSTNRFRVDLLPVKINFSACRVVKAQERASDRRLATAGLSDQPECLARSDIERYAVNRFQRLGVKPSRLDREIHLHIMCLDQILTVRRELSFHPLRLLSLFRNLHEQCHQPSAICRCHP